MYYIRGFLKGCKTCQLYKVGSTSKRQFENRINLYYISKLCCDIKQIHSMGNKFILVVTGEVTNYLVTSPMYRGIPNEIKEALINHAFGEHGPKLFNL